MSGQSPRLARPRIDPQRVRAIRDRLIRWGATNDRTFSWRRPNPAPFDVLVCEILLAKTRAELAEPVAAILLERYPDARTLARARTRDLERLLRPLGLHRKRARYLRACAGDLVARFDGTVPTTVPELMSLPYVGAYAASAIACVAFGVAVPVIDVNVARIYARAFSVAIPPRLSKAKDLGVVAGRLLPPRRARAFNWALLDLGSLICTPRAPACSSCPIAAYCDQGRAARAVGDAPARPAGR